MKLIKYKVSNKPYVPVTNSINLNTSRGVRSKILNRVRHEINNWAIIHRIEDGFRR
jgi:hypothetical protein